MRCSVTLRLRGGLGCTLLSTPVSGMCEAAMFVSGVAARVVAFEPCSIVIVPHDVRVEEAFQAAYDEDLFRAYAPSLVSSSWSEALSPPLSSSSEPSSVD